MKQPASISEQPYPSRAVPRVPNRPPHHEHDRTRGPQALFWATRAGAGTPRPQDRAVYAFEDEDGNGGSGHVCAKAKKCELCEVK